MFSVLDDRKVFFIPCQLGTKEPSTGSNYTHLVICNVLFLPDIYYFQYILILSDCYSE